MLLRPPKARTSCSTKLSPLNPSVPEWAALALDTKTGSLCLTYQLNADKDHPQLKNLPTCKDLYVKDRE